MLSSFEPRRSLQSPSLSPTRNHLPLPSVPTLWSPAARLASNFDSRADMFPFLSKSSPYTVRVRSGFRMVSTLHTHALVLALPMSRSPFNFVSLSSRILTSPQRWLHQPRPLFQPRTGAVVEILSSALSVLDLPSPRVPQTLCSLCLTGSRLFLAYE